MTQFAQFKSETGALPYSVTAAGVIYNKALFDKVGVQVPATWSELLAVCEAFKAKGIVPIQQTFKDTWTLSQGIFDYVSGSALDVSAFFKELKALGPGAGPGASVSFSKDFRGALAKMVKLLDYTNPDAPSRGYGDGNVAFAGGKAAMYLQGPWAIGEIVKINPKAQIGTFAMPASDNKEDVKDRIHLYTALQIPSDSPRQTA